MFQFGQVLEVIIFPYFGLRIIKFDFSTNFFLFQDSIIFLIMYFRFQFSLNENITQLLSVFFFVFLIENC